MKKETAAQKLQRHNTTVCECGHSQAWHWGKETHSGICQFPDCQCNRFSPPSKGAR